MPMARKNPMPKDIDDNFRSIFSDLISAVANAINGGALGSGGVVEDFTQFLEHRDDGQAYNRQNGDVDNL